VIKTNKHTDTMKTIDNKYGIEIDAQFIADKFADKFWMANEKLVNEVIEDSSFEEIQANKDGMDMSLVILSSKGKQVAGWVKGGPRFEEYTKVTKAVPGYSFEEGLEAIMNYINS